MSECRACLVTNQHRTTQRRPPRSDPIESRLVAEMVDHARRQPRYGYRRVHVLLARDGWRVNHKRIERLWRAEGLQVRQAQRKRRRLGRSENGIKHLSAGAPNDVWSYDFVFDRTEDGRPLKILTMVDEYTREALAIHVDRSIKAHDVIDVLLPLFLERGPPKHIRSDNGSEFVAHAIRDWLALAGVHTAFIEPGSPWENGYCESFNGKLRDELLAGELFTSLLEAQVLAEEFLREYNTYRPHRSLDNKTPAEYAASWAPSGSAPPPGAQLHEPQNPQPALIVGGLAKGGRSPHRGRPPAREGRPRWGHHSPSRITRNPEAPCF